MRISRKWSGKVVVPGVARAKAPPATTLHPFWQRDSGKAVVSCKPVCNRLAKPKRRQGSGRNLFHAGLLNIGFASLRHGSGRLIAALGWLWVALPRIATA